MLDLVKTETERIDSRFLEPACGSGNFLIPVLQRKLAAVDLKYKKNAFERLQHAFFGLMCIYGIELLEDNASECREKLLEVFVTHLEIQPDSSEFAAAKAVLKANIIHGDALSLKDHKGAPIVFPEWAYLGKGQFSRRDFKYDELLQLGSFGEGTLFESLEAADIFAPIKDFPAMTVKDLANFDAGWG
jgi:hypothetical protein